MSAANIPTSIWENEHYMLPANTHPAAQISTFGLYAVAPYRSSGDLYQRENTCEKANMVSVGQVPSRKSASCWGSLLPLEWTGDQTQQIFWPIQNHQAEFHLARQNQSGIARRKFSLCIWEVVHLILRLLFRIRNIFRRMGLNCWMMGWNITCLLMKLANYLVLYLCGRLTSYE